MGDPGKIVLLQGVLSVMKRDCLLSVVQSTGDVLLQGLCSMQNDFPNLINSVRGRGTFLAFNAASAKLRDDIIKKLKQKGKAITNFKYLTFSKNSYP